MKKYLFLLVALFFVLAWLPSARGEVLYYPAGDHYISAIDIQDSHTAIYGAGSGITVLHVDGGIFISGTEPRLRGFTLVGAGTGTGLTLKNCMRARVEDVEIYGYELGLLSLCEWGSRQWLHTYRDLYVYEVQDGHGNSHDVNIRGVELRYTGDKVPGGGWLPGGEFSNTHTFRGGRIAVPGTPLLLDGPTATTLFGTYIDMDSAPLRMTARSAGLQLFGVHLDRNWHARNIGIPALVLEDAHFNRVKIFGQHTGLLQQDLIVDGLGMPIDPTRIFISPEGY